MSGLIKWIDDRLPIVDAFEKHMSKVLRAEELQCLVCLRGSVVCGIGQPAPDRDLADHDVHAHGRGRLRLR